MPPKKKKHSIRKNNTKYDQDKIKYELMPMSVLRQIAMVFTYGARKYEPNLYKKGLDYSRYVGAALRHIYAWWGGELRDPESGIHHLAHAITCLMFLMHYDEIHPECDDRDKKYDLPFENGVDKFDVVNKPSVDIDEVLKKHIDAVKKFTPLKTRKKR